MRGVLLNNFYSARVSLLVVRVFSVRCCYGLNKLGSASNRIYAVWKPSRRYHSALAALGRYITTALGLPNRVDPWMRCLTII